MPIDIIGPGAIGLHLTLAMPEDTPVRLRHPTADSGRQTVIEDDTGRRRTIEWQSLSARSPVIQHAVITTKAYQVADALAGIIPLLGEQPDVLLLHNGLGPQEEAARAMPPDARLLAGATTEGALRTGPGRIRHTGTGMTWLGPWVGSTSPGYLARTLAVGGLKAHWEPSPARVRQRLWEKLVINCAINPLTALENRPNGDLASPALRARWSALVAEAVQVARADDISLDADVMVHQVDAVIAGTASNFSSMHQDLHHGRPTEAPYIVGILVNKADTHDLPAPLLRNLWQQLSCK